MEIHKLRTEISQRLENESAKTNSSSAEAKDAAENVPKPQATKSNKYASNITTYGLYMEILHAIENSFLLINWLMLFKSLARFAHLLVFDIIRISYYMYRCKLIAIRPYSVTDYVL